MFVIFHSPSRHLALLLTLLIISSARAADAPKPTLYLIGDSTVNNSANGQQGWGKPIALMFDPTRITVQNKARGGRSSRTYFSEGLWQQVLDQLKPGDFVLIQFGHNDGGKVSSDPRNRASLKGTGEETQDITLDDKSNKTETVHTYGWYLRRYVTDAKSKGATAIICSPIPRNIWKENNTKVARADNDYGKWAAEIAKSEGIPFIDLNDIIARKYEQLGQEKVAAEFFTPTDHTHTTPAGAKLNAESVIQGIRGLDDCRLKEFLAN
jgi:lysophospholipase L1-like esterase